MKRNCQENDLPERRPEPPSPLSRNQELASVDPSLILSYDRTTVGSPVQWSDFDHIVVL